MVPNKTLITKSDNTTIEVLTNVSGETKDTINGITYVFVVVSIFLMQCFVEWKKFLIKYTSGSSNRQSTVTGVLKRSGYNQIITVHF